MKKYKRLFESPEKKRLAYSFKCTDADEDGIFSDGVCPFGEIDTNEFAEFIQSMEKFPITEDQFRKSFVLPKFDPISVELRQRTPEFQIFADLSGKEKYVILFDGDVHYIYETV
jgi:hypothetical protein